MVEENVFINGGEFCMSEEYDRWLKDPTCKPTPVDWHYFAGADKDFPVVFLDHLRNTFRSCTPRGRVGYDGGAYDLIPLEPPEYVPWESPDDVPDGYFRRKGDTAVCPASGYDVDGLWLFGMGVFASWNVLLDRYEHHTDRKAKDGWQVCGKVKNA